MIITEFDGWLIFNMFKNVEDKDFFYQHLEHSAG